MTLGDRYISEADWPANRAKTAVARFYERLSKFKKGKLLRKTPERLTSDLHIYSYDPCEGVYPFHDYNTHILIHHTHIYTYNIHTHVYTPQTHSNACMQHTHIHTHMYTPHTNTNIHAPHTYAYSTHMHIIHTHK